VGADLSGASLAAARLGQADLCRARLTSADLSTARLYRANLRQADLSGANLQGARCRRASLGEAVLQSANVTGADLRHASLRGATLIGAQVVGASLEYADLTGCHIYGISAWNVRLQGAIQQNILVTPPGEPAITVDNLEVAQFVYLLLHNQRIRDVIDTITSKVVLILGRFTPERKAVLDALRDELRKHDYLPILFDFDQPAQRSVQETVSTLAHMARFVLADITDPRSIPQELAAIVPQLPSVPVQPLLHVSGTPWGMWEHFPRYPWVLPIHRYEDAESLLTSLASAVIAPAEAKAAELQRRTSLAPS
jgi:hypothetical protein